MVNASPTLVVMAAGLGSRFGGDKQIEGVGPRGEALFEYAAFDAHRAGFTRVVFVVRDAILNTVARIASAFPSALDVAFARQRVDDVPAWFVGPARTRPWGTAHAVLAARECLDTPFAVVNADDFYGAEAYAFAARAAADAGRTGEHAIVGFRLDRTLSDHGPVVRAIPTVSGSSLVALEEVREIQRDDRGIAGRTREATRRLAGTEVVSMNCWVFAPAIVAALQERFESFLRTEGASAAAELALPEAVNDLVASGRIRVKVFEAPGPWLGMTHRADLDDVRVGVRALVASGAYPDPLWGAPADAGGEE